MIKMKPWIALPTLLIVTAIYWPEKVWSHGVVMEASPIPSFQIQAKYESGEPMANAQINVYAPNDPQTVWLQTLTDEQGNFLFTPDPELIGTWDIQARLAGHGDLIQIQVEEDGSVSQLTQANNSPLQKWLTIGAVVWGFVGTALFFAKKPQT